MKINSSISGLASPGFINIYNSKNFLNFNTVSTEMANYHKIVLDPCTHIEYHLAGYGLTLEESVQRLLGETIERYALLMSNALLKHKIERMSFTQLQKQKKRVIKFEYLNTFTDKQCALLNKHFTQTLNNITHDSVIEWIPVYSFADQEEIYMPFSLFKLGKKVDSNFLFGTSTGTATHVNYKRALINSLVEYFQLHTFMSTWYLREKIPQINWKESEFLRNAIEKTKVNDNYEVIILQARESLLNFTTYITFLINKENKFPFLTCGIQGGGGEQAIIRSFLKL